MHALCMHISMYVMYVFMYVMYVIHILSYIMYRRAVNKSEVFFIGGALCKESYGFQKGIHCHPHRSTLQASKLHGSGIGLHD